jgi:cytochrome oxidase assembly protein ShyY1
MTERRAITWLAACVAVLAVAVILLAVAHWQLRRQLDTACDGVIATLDLTEWVPLCR